MLPKNRSGLNSKGSEYVLSSRSIALRQYGVKTKVGDAFDSPDIDENVGTCRNEIPIVLVIDSRTSHGYKDRVNLKVGRG